MDGFAPLLQILNAGGNLAMIAVAWALWRHDRRIVRLETHAFGADGMRE